VVLANRGNYIAAALTVLRAYIAEMRDFSCGCRNVDVPVLGEPSPVARRKHAALSPILLTSVGTELRRIFTIHQDVRRRQ
jgi:hypothetical protein